VVGRIGKAKALQRPPPRLEEGLQGGEIIEAAQGLPDHIAPPSVRPGGGAGLVAGGQRDDVGAPLDRPGRAEGEARRETDIDEGWDQGRTPLKTGRCGAKGFLRSGELL
jgi:hypothetical protein